MACNVNIKADNGENSILFKSIAEVISDPNEAVDLYFYTKTDDFKKLYGDYTSEDFDTRKLDANDEPRYESFSREAYMDDVDYNNIELSNSAEVYKTLLETVPKAIEMIEPRISYLEASSDVDMESLSKLKDLHKILTTQDINTSIPRFVEMANKHVAAIRKKADRSKKNPDSDIRELSSLNKTAQSYSMLSELKAELSEDPEVQAIFGGGLESMDTTIGNIQHIQSTYLSKSMDVLVEEFHKRDRSWSKKDIRNNLKHASRDVTFTEQMLEYLGDSTDRVLSTVGAIMMEAKHKQNRAAIDFNKNLADKLELVEKSTSLKGDEIFKEVIVEDDNGEVHYINPEAEFTNGKNPLMDKMYNKLQKVKGNTALMDFLLFFDEEYTTLNAMLPPSTRMDTRLPSVLRSDWELLGGKSIKEKYGLITDNVVKKLQRSNLEMERGLILDDTGKPVKRIPTFYTQKYNSIDYNAAYTTHFNELVKDGMSEADAGEVAAAKAEVDATKKMSEFISRDLAGSLQAFHAMATNYATKSELVHIFESALAVVGSNKRTYSLVDSGGISYKNIKTGKDIPIRGPQSNAKKVLEKFLDMQLYGQREKDLGYVDIFGMKIDTNSTLRALNNTTGLVQQSANVLSGIANIGNGEYNTIMEAIGGEFFTTTDLAHASGVYKQNIGGILSDIGERTPKNIVNLLEEHYNILQSFESDIKSTEQSKVKRLMKTSTLYFIQTSGEHFMQVRGGLAMLNATKTYDKNGKEVSNLLKAHSVKNGKLKIDEGLFIKDKEGSLVAFDTNQQNRISNKIGAVLRSMHGNYSTDTANAMKQDARLALVQKYRNWIYPGVIRRFSKTRPNHMLEQDMEGFYRTGARVLWGMRNELKTMQFQLMKEKWQNLSAHEKANIRRFVTETATITLLGISGAMLGHAGKLMDEEFNTDSMSDRMVLGTYALLNYEVNRLYTEVFAYINPLEAVRLMRSPTASQSIIEGLLKLTGQLVTDPFETYDVGWRKGEYKIGAKLEKLVPVYKQLKTLNIDGIQDRGAFYEL